MSKRRFHVALHGWPQDEAPRAVAAKVWEQPAETLTSEKPLAQVPLPVTFEEAEAALSRLPRLYFEPDGSFGWFAAPGAPRWEIGGLLYDRGDRLMYAELNGFCPATEFRQIAAALNHGSARLVVQLIEPALFLESDEFCRLLETL